MQVRSACQEGSGVGGERVEEEAVGDETCYLRGTSVFFLVLRVYMLDT